MLVCLMEDWVCRHSRFACLHHLFFSEVVVNAILKFFLLMLQQYFLKGSQRPNFLISACHATAIIEVLFFVFSMLPVMSVGRCFCGRAEHVWVSILPLFPLAIGNGEMEASKCLSCFHHCNLIL